MAYGTPVPKWGWVQMPSRSDTMRPKTRSVCKSSSFYVRWLCGFIASNAYMAGNMPEYTAGNVYTIA